MSGEQADRLIRELTGWQEELRTVQARADADGEHALAALDRAEALERELAQRTWRADIPPSLGSVEVDSDGYIVDLTLDRNVRTSDLSKLGERVLAAISAAQSQQKADLLPRLDEIFRHVGE